MGTGLVGLVLASESSSFWEMGDGIRQILFWVFGAIFVVFGLLFPVLMFLAALLEKQRVRPLAQACEDDRRAAEAPPVVEAAIAMEYRPLGLFSNGETGRKKKLIFLLLSQDGHILLQVWPKKRYQAMSRLHSGHWLISADTLPVRDLSGLEWQEMLPDAALDMLLKHHRHRIQQAGQPCAPFSCEDAPANLFEHERACVVRLKELGLARYVGTGQDTWAFTIRGAVKVAGQATRILRMLREDRKRVESLKQQAGTLPLER